MSRFDDAVRKYNAEVDEVAARLVEQGMAPWEARQEATQYVRDRRRVEQMFPKKKRKEGSADGR